jgi:predicted small metal-binding protein
MKQFACGDVVPGCSRSFAAESVDGVLEQVAVHARADHGLVDIPTGLVEQVVAAIR